ncbi:hypothetical protein [Aminobacter carboxidus]|uniref:Uncharacterized protein n=1 Tax=Aminobacter carboxidus TaxID=376165 RepID=A0ABR9GRC5_9HYPH|nr:hypothetical protein [Aminobacter carboxidus]MBE1206233.1 hypothetical protein [Aminobacter carboxidus]
MKATANSSFIIELTYAADKASTLTPNETARLLQQAAATIRNYRQQVGHSETPANDCSQGDIVFDLLAMASAVELFSPQKVSALLQEAASTIRACKIIGETGTVSANDP